MKISDKTLVDLQKTGAKAKEKSTNTDGSMNSSTSRSDDVVDLKLSKTLQGISEAIQGAGLTAGQLHSEVNASRASALLESFDRVGESKQPRVSDEAIFEALDRAIVSMAAEPTAASQAFGEISRARVEELLS